MKKENKSSADGINLRHRAEQKLKVAEEQTPLSKTEPDVLKLVHELQVHQIELEMQNEELRQAKDDANIWLALYTDLFDFAPVGYFTLDRQSVIHKVNLIGLSLIGEKGSRLIKRRFGFFVSPETRPVFNTFLQNAFESRTKQICEIILLTKADVSICVRIEAVVPRDSEECHIVLEDITERKQSEQKLRESEEKHRTILQTAMDGFWLMDTQGHLLEVNETYCKMSGYSKQELLSICISDLEAAEVEDDIAAHILSVEYQGETRFESRHRRKDGSIFDVAVSVQYWSIAGGQMVAFLQDITERKRMEEDKRRFYHDTIKSVTQGKLELVSNGDIKEYLDSAELVMHVIHPADSTIARHKITELCRLQGIDNDRLRLFELGVGEAITNAIKHAKECRIYAGVYDDFIWVAISDSGQGISTLTLPNATLRKGYSTMTSMGMGFSLMMETSDNIKLSTNTEGTTVLLSIKITAPQLDITLNDLPDTWDTPLLLMA